MLLLPHISLWPVGKEYWRLAKTTWNAHVESLETCFHVCWWQVSDTTKVISAICQSLRKRQTCATFFFSPWQKMRPVLPLGCSNTGTELPSASLSLLPCFASPRVKHPLLLLTAHCAQLSAALRLIYGSPPAPPPPPLSHPPSLCRDDVIIVAVYCCLATGARWR